MIFPSASAHGRQPNRGRLPRGQAASRSLREPRPDRPRRQWQTTGVTTGDWVQVVVSAIGVVLTGVVAVLIFRLESKDRRRQEEAGKALQAQALTEEVRLRERELRERQESERRSVRREQHGADYRESIEVLEVASSIFQAVADKPRTSAEIDDMGAEKAIVSLDRLAARVPAVSGVLSQVSTQLSIIGAWDFPERAHTLSGRVVEGSFESIREFVRDSLGNWAQQHSNAVKGLSYVAKAREAIAKEWGV